MTPILTRTRRLPLAAGALALMFILTNEAAPASAAQGPTALVTTVGTQGIQALGGNTTERLARLSQLFQSDFDIPGIGLFALGRYRSMATPQETQEYFRLYPTFTVVAFNSRLDEYRGAPFRVTGKRKIGGGVTLISSELTPNGGRVQFDWHLIKSGPAREYRISDVTIGGVSMKIALRDQFASWIQNNGGRFDALLAVMRQQIAQSR
jgi:phospholipid transport system substrate-binding protein